MFVLTRTSFIIAGFTATFALSSFHTAAQTSQERQSPGPTVEEEIIVTANRIPQAASETLTATTIFDEEAIRSSLASGVFELLNGQAGIQMARTGGLGGQTSLFMRGTESDHTLVLVDGIKVNTASEGFARLENLPIDQITRVEIARGGHSSLYGSEAIGGVIQIFTRQAHADNARGYTGSDGITGGDINVGIGTEQSYNSSATVDAELYGTAVNLSYSHRETEGIDSSQSPFTSADRDGFTHDSLGITLARALNADSSLSAGYTLSTAESEFDDGVSDATNQRAWLKGETRLAGNWLTEATVDYFEDENDTLSGTLSTSKTERTGARWLNRFELFDESDLALGVDYHDEKLNYSGSGAVQSGKSRDNLGIYAVYGHTFMTDSQALSGLGPIDTTLSLRRDDNEQFGVHSTGKFAFGLNPVDWLQIWASYGTAFKAPNLVDLYVDFPGFFFYANPDLEPETSRNTELGINATVLNANWSVSLFHNEIEDLIASNATFDSLTNISRADIDGIELSVNTEILGWGVNAALTLLDHENAITGEQLVRRPDESATLEVARRFDRLRLAVNWLAQSEHLDVDPLTYGPSIVGGYGIVDLIAAYRFDDNLRVQFKAGNIFDKTYEVVDGFNTYGTTALLSASYSF